MNTNYSYDAVRALAYQLWKDRGGVGGSPDEDWFRAEEILSDEHRAALQDTALDNVTGEFTGQASSPAAVLERRKATERVDHAVEESFPASDPPATSVADEPPVNAGAKWQAAKTARRGKGSVV